MQDRRAANENAAWLRHLANAAVPFVAALLAIVALILWRVAVLEAASEREDAADRSVVLAAALRGNLASLESVDREFLLAGVPHSDRARLVDTVERQFRELKTRVAPTQENRLARMYVTYRRWRQTSERLMRERAAAKTTRTYTRSELRETLAHTLNADADALLSAGSEVRSVASRASNAATREALVVTVVATFVIGGILGLFVWTSMLRASRERERMWEESRILKEAQGRSAELEEQNRQIRETARVKSEFVAHMSHELRTPLTAILGLSEMLYDEKAGNVSATQKAYLNDILVSGRHLLDLISEVLDLAKLEAGKIQMSYSECDPRAIAREVIETLQPIAQKKPVVLTMELENCPTSVTSDASRLRQVLYNYISNAVKFTPPGGSVTVRILQCSNDRFRIEVQDTGIGIAAEDLQQLFRDFSQLDTAAHEGAGLGLALTKRIVESQGGTVGVLSRKGAGSLFYAELPLKPVVPIEAFVA